MKLRSLPQRDGAQHKTQILSVTLGCFFSLLGGQVTGFALSISEASPVDPILSDKVNSSPQVI